MDTERYLVLLSCSFTLDGTVQPIIHRIHPAVQHTIIKAGRGLAKDMQQLGTTARLTKCGIVHKLKYLQQLLEYSASSSSIDNQITPSKGWRNFRQPQFVKEPMLPLLESKGSLTDL